MCRSLQDVAIRHVSTVRDRCRYVGNLASNGLLADIPNTTSLTDAVEKVLVITDLA
jgi:hypothetical protein